MNTSKVKEFREYTYRKCMKCEYVDFTAKMSNRCLKCGSDIVGLFVVGYFKG